MRISIDIWKNANENTIQLEKMEDKDMMDEKLFNVIGIDDLEGTTFARCTTYEKAQKVKELLEAEGFEYMLDIVQDELPIDIIEIGGKLIEL